MYSEQPTNLQILATVLTTKLTTVCSVIYIVSEGYYYYCIETNWALKSIIIVIWGTKLT